MLELLKFVASLAVIFVVVVVVDVIVEVAVGVVMGKLDALIKSVPNKDAYLNVETGLSTCGGGLCMV